MINVGHINMKEVTAYGVVGTSLANEVSGDMIVTAESLENLVFLGVTYGAWFKIALGIALVLLIAQRARDLWKDWRDKE